MMEAEREDQAEDKTRPDELDRRLVAIRRDGYEVMPSVQSEAVYNLSAPILGANGTAIAALTCPFLPRIDRPNVPGRDDVLKILVATTQELSEALGRGGGTASLG